MRLRFIICRHTLTLTPVVLDIHPTLTVAQLLEEVHAVIPLESGEWGLDDYAVELPGEFHYNFECLHYELVGKIMKEDDEVIIRPLSGQDLKLRRVSGRRQISSDGKHLVDGVAFGRAFPRQPPERPDINLPPRKRLRLENAEDEDEDEDDVGTLALKHKLPLKRHDSAHGKDSDKPLILEADFDDDDSEDDEDYTPHDDENDDNDDYDDEEEHESGAGGDQGEEGYEEEGGADEELSQNNTEDSPSHKGQRLSPRGNFRKLHSAFPTSPISVCKNVLSANNGDLAEAYDTMAQGFQPAKAKGAITEVTQARLLIPKTRSKKPKVATEEPEDLDRELVELEESTDSLFGYYDQNGLPKGSIASGTALSHMAEVLKTSTGRALEIPKGRVVSNKSVRFAEDSLVAGLTSTPLLEVGSQIDNSEEENDEESSSEENVPSSDEESDSTDNSETSSSGTDSDSNHSESGSGSSSDDDSAPEETSSKTTPDNQKAPVDAVLRPAANNQKPVPPGEGRKQTRARNTRRRNAKALQRLQEQGILPADTTAAEFNKLGIDSNTTKEDALAALDALRSAPLPEMNDDFQARRQELLDSLQSGGIEVGHESSTKASKSPSVAHPKPTATKDVDEIINDAIADDSAQSIPPTPESGDASTPTSRRARLDLGAGRRLLFGALGIKPPKSKLDEEKIRNNLMKDVRPLVTAKPDESTHPVNDDELNEDPDAWRRFITYRAVECCQDNVELSEPPFPFIQRWDPQQQGHRSKQGNQGGKRKKDQRDDLQYYDSNQRASKKQKLGKAKHSYADEQEYLDGSYEPSYQENSAVIDYDQESMLQNSNAKIGISSQLLNEGSYTKSAGSSQEPTDLAPLPENPAILPDLNADQIMTGMTIAFKQLIMSEETKWQPQISPYRTAIVIAYPENGELHLTLALRDRQQPDKDYDEQTGDRIYGRFDMPVEDDNEEMPEDDGMLTVGFNELIEPKVVQNAPDSLVIDAATDDTTLVVSLPSLANSSTFNKTSGTTEDQFSHVTETPLNSEVPESNLSAQVINNSEQESMPQEVEGDRRDAERQSSAHKVNARVDESQQPASLPDPKGKTVEGGNAEITGSPVNVTETISDEARKEISFMMKEAGFRSSVPPSIRKDICPGGIASPGDEAVFEKLMKDMTDIENHFPSSPKFNGFDSSPPTRPSGESVNQTADISQRFSSSPAPPQSSWQTIAFDEPSSPPAKTQEREIRQEASDGAGESWETIDPSALSKPLPTRKTKKKFQLHKAQFIQKANALWEQLSRPTGNDASGDSAMDSVKGAQEPTTQPGLNTIDARYSNASVQYPHLSVGSSFTSQISDHGRQPDVVFEDSTLYGDIPKAITEESPVDHDHEVQLPDDLVFDAEPELPSHPTKNIHLSKRRRKEALLDLPSSDDDPFPTLEVVLSQRAMTPEESAHVPSRNANKDGQELNATVSGDEQFSEESNHSTPKAARSGSRTPRRSASQPNPRTRSSMARSSQTPASQSKANKFVVPQGSQVMDLTLSSDADEEQGSLLDHMPVFRRYKIADDDDDDYNDRGGIGKKGGGWVNKKASSQTTETPKRTGTRLRSSSQASLNPRSSRKKTVAKF